MSVHLCYLASGHCIGDNVSIIIWFKEPAQKVKLKEQCYRDFFVSAQNYTVTWQSSYLYKWVKNTETVMLEINGWEN